MDREIEEKDIRLFYEKVYSFIGHDAFKVTDIAKAFDITSRKATSLLTKLIESNNAIRYWVKNELYYRLNAEYDPSGHTFIYKYLNKCNVPKTNTVTITMKIQLIHVLRTEKLKGYLYTMNISIM